MHEYLVSYRGPTLFGDTVIKTDEPLAASDIPLIRTMINDARARDGRLEILNPIILSIHKFER